MITREEVRQNRIKWANFLLEPGRRKATGALDRGMEDERCCLGHGAFCLGVPNKLSGTLGNGGLFVYGEAEEDCTAPQELIDLVGLWDEEGDLVGEDYEDEFYHYIEYKQKVYVSLALWNDSSAVTPQEIGAYLLTVIEGGVGTPFRLLTDYPEEI